MRKYLLILLLVPSLAGAIDIVRQGDLVVVKANCFAFNLSSLNQKIPEGVTTLNQMALIFASSLRDLSPEEQAICDGTIVQPLGWKVHDNGNLTRPAYTYTNGQLVKHPTARATIGEVCGDFVVPVANRKTEYRYLVSAPELVAICEYL